MGAGAGTPTGVVAARATAAQHGEGGSRPTRGREGGGKAEEDAWHGLERRGGGGGTTHGRQERRGASGRGTEEAGAGGGRRGLAYDFPKMQGPYYNVLVTFKPEL
jgi:hypothetical protein